MYYTEICFVNFIYEQKRGLQNALISTNVINVRFCSHYLLKSTFTFFLASSLSALNKSRGLKLNIPAIILDGNTSNFVL